MVWSSSLCLQVAINWLTPKIEPYVVLILNVQYAATADSFMRKHQLSLLQLAEKDLLIFLTVQVWPSFLLGMCYNLNMKCPPQVHVLKAWSPAGGTILGGYRNSRRWGLAREVGHWRHAFEGCTWPSSVSPPPLHLICFLSTMRWTASSSTCSHHYRPRINGTKDYGLKFLKWLFISGIWS
jgi:hypothetical protein